MDDPTREQAKRPGTKSERMPGSCECSLKYYLSTYISKMIVTSCNDIMIICFPLRVGKALHMSSRVMMTCLWIHQHPQPILPKSYAQTKFHNPISAPVTLSPRYFSVPSYQSLQFIKTKDQNNVKLCTKNIWNNK